MLPNRNTPLHQVTYLCEDTEGNTVTSSAESNEMALLVDRGFVSNPICQIFGDPHVITFDQKIYSFQVAVPRFSGFSFKQNLLSDPPSPPIPF